jgi:hypothetical protein
MTARWDLPLTDLQTDGSATTISRTWSPDGAVVAAFGHDVLIPSRSTRGAVAAHPLGGTDR